MVKAWQQLVERAGLPVAYSRGFHPVALLQYSPPLPVGYGAQAEWVDIFLRDRMSPNEVVQRLEAAAPRDMRLFAPAEIEVGARALDRSIVGADYEIRLCGVFLAAHGLSLGEIENLWREARTSVMAGQKDAQEKDSILRAASLIESLEIASLEPAILHIRVRQSEGNLTDPLRLLRAMLGIEIVAGEDAEVTRLGLVGAILPPRIPGRLRE
jgi:radical SAM-linked protein